MSNSDRRRPEPGTPLQQVIAAAIRHHRDRLDLTQSALAQLMSEVLGIKWTDTTVAKIEKGGTRNVTVEELVGLSIVLRTSIPDLLWSSEPGADPDTDRDMDRQVLVGTYAVSNGDLRDLVNSFGWPKAPVPDDLPPPAWAALTGDVGLREQVDAAMADWAEGMRLLRKPVTESARRAERAARWQELAANYTMDPDSDWGAK